MGYLEYAQSLIRRQEQIRTRILVDPKLKQPLLHHDKDGFVMALPEPIMHEEETISFSGYQFLSEPIGKSQLSRLFKACVFHLNAHIATSNPDIYTEWRKKKEERLAKFSETLVEDTKVNAYILTHNPDELIDIAFANSLASKRSKPLGRIWSQATRIMAASLLQANLGTIKDRMQKEERKTVSRISKKLRQLKNRVLRSFAKEQASVGDVELRIADEIYHALEFYGPVLEVPSLPHTEQIGSSTLFPSYLVQPNDGVGALLDRCLTALREKPSGGKSQTMMQKKTAEAEALQIFDSWVHEKAKEKKILSRFEGPISLTRFRSIEFPREDYTEYLRARTKVRSESRRLLSSLMVAFDALDEDPRKMYGVLDLQDVIQVTASKSPRMDVFKLEENIGKSYAWVILLDASRSMRGLEDYARNLGICLAETAKELLRDSASWGFYAFNDRFLILKDPAERYGAKTKARMGGLRFEGLTYMPDALKLAAEFLKKRSENLRVMTILSDGWPYGYSNITEALTETLDFLRKTGIIVIGLGVKTNRMKNFFRINSNIKTAKDLRKKFSNLYMNAARGAVGL
ncbi:MAG: hypothetical protein JSW53_06235 [Candidatus Bathyarchaeota archaeon]|nr:MAG: hypothetical protein JSW53_06235 [Candidatus Bathyarchaeota archaeon]